MNMKSESNLKLSEAITIPCEPSGIFIYIPASLTPQYISDVISKYFGRQTIVCSYKAESLCANNELRVSNSGATVLKLSLLLSNGETLNVVAKILSSEVLNLFKLDKFFASRINELN